MVVIPAPPEEVAAEITAIYFANNMVHLEWNGTAGKTHIVQASETPSGAWTTIETIPSAPAQNSREFALVAGKARFFRVTVQ